jgi:hypothetical protein
MAPPSKQPAAAAPVNIKAIPIEERLCMSLEALSKKASAVAAPAQPK